MLELTCLTREDLARCSCSWRCLLARFASRRVPRLVALDLFLIQNWTPSWICIITPMDPHGAKTVGPKNVGYSTTSVTRHRRLLNIVGYSTSSGTQHRRLLNIVGDSISPTLSTIEIRRRIKKIRDLGLVREPTTRPHQFAYFIRLICWLFLRSSPYLFIG
jgi:hypothetical protein